MLCAFTPMIFFSEFTKFGYRINDTNLSISENTDSPKSPGIQNPQLEEKSAKDLLNLYVYVLLNPSRFENPKETASYLERYLHEKHRIQVNPSLVVELLKQNPSNKTGGHGNAPQGLQLSHGKYSCMSF